MPGMTKLGMAVALILASTPAALAAQSIAQRVAAARDGKVRLTFASRPDLCGYGNGISKVTNTNSRTHWSSERSDDVDYDLDCGTGPARIVVTVQNGRIERIRSYIGGRWRPASNVTDLGNVSVRSAIDFLMGVASTAPEKQAGQAIHATTLADSVEMARPLHRLALDESRSDEVRGHAIFWMGQLPSGEAVDLLAQLLRGRHSDKVREKAIFALSQHHSGRGSAVLRDFAERGDGSDKLRGNAIFWLGQKRTDENAAYLRGLYARVGSEELKDKIIFSLAHKRWEGNEDWLLGLVANPSEPREMRKKAIFWAGQGGVPMPRLAALYDRLQDREMKEQLIFAFSQRRQSEATEKLMQIARSDPDRELRRKAMFWLGQSKDPRVVSFLTDIITR